MKKISEYLKSDFVLQIEAETRDEALKKIVDNFEKQNMLVDKKAFYEAILEREKIVSTGIGMSVAIPHAKLACYDDFFITIAIIKNGVDWKSMDGAPVRIVFMIGGPDDKQTEYLQILSAITMAVKDEERRKKILTLQSPEAIVELFSGY